MVPLVSRKLVTAVAVIGAVLPVTIAWGAADFSYGGTPRYLAGMAQTSGAAYRNYNRMYGNGQRHQVRLLRAGRPERHLLRRDDLHASNSSYVNIGSSGSYGYGTAAAKCGDYVTLWVDCHTTQP